ncbi:8420_t:CDS:2 [Paraglomus occultum]|uniref:8420_t:CDS:1 n=1 Tax=Paraglomus occultum TaxID=144539 RepID=A0A9N8WHP3_9GLOM|nr:8420_t:CDS:2 [Paraglomus occultum]
MAKFNNKISISLITVSFISLPLVLFLRKKLSMLSRRKRGEIPRSDNALELTNPENTDDILSFLRNVLPGWSDVKTAEIKRVSGALTNSVFFVTALTETPKASPRKILLRVYGTGADQVIDRERELKFLEMLGSLNIGPSILALFQNGRVEQFLPSRTLTNQDIRNQETSRQIARLIARLHSNVPGPSTKDVVPEVWANINKWYDIAVKLTTTEMREASIEILNLDALRDEINELRHYVDMLDSPIVFSHNDAQCGNFLRLTDGTNELVIVDFEYSGYNYRGFDLANHFCEWAYDYHSEEPHKMKPDLYPTILEQNNFLRAYLEVEKKSRNDKIEVELAQRRLECDVFSLTSHVLWGLWGVLQHYQSQIPFEYLPYAAGRLEEFRRVKEGIYKQLIESRGQSSQ